MLRSEIEKKRVVEGEISAGMALVKRIGHNHVGKSILVVNSVCRKPKGMRLDSIGNVLVDRKLKWTLVN